jgi:hypothetical protein
MDVFDDVDTGAQVCLELSGDGVWDWAVAEATRVAALTDRLQQTADAESAAYLAELAEAMMDSDGRAEGGREGKPPEQLMASPVERKRETEKRKAAIVANSDELRDSFLSALTADIASTLRISEERVVDLKVNTAAQSVTFAFYSGVTNCEALRSAPASPPASPLPQDLSNRSTPSLDGGGDKDVKMDAKMSSDAELGPPPADPSDTDAAAAAGFSPNRSRDLSGDKLQPAVLAVTYKAAVDSYSGGDEHVAHAASFEALEAGCPRTPEGAPLVVSAHVTAAGHEPSPKRGLINELQFYHAMRQIRESLSKFIIDTPSSSLSPSSLPSPKAWFSPFLWS